MHIACLTFDFDAVSGFIAKGMRSPTPISRGEFGLVGADRILDLLKRHDIPATWFIPGHTIETYPEMSVRIAVAGHEIGHHGWTHMTPVTMSRDEEEAGLQRGTDAIVKLCGRKPRGYRSPAWDLSENTVDLLVSRGFLYESSMMGNDYTPYFARTGDVIALEEPMQLGPETSLVEMPISWTLDDYPHFEYVRNARYSMQGLMPAGGVLQNWVDDFDYMTRTVDWGVLTYTCHPFVIGRGHRMMMLERLIEALQGLGAVFMTMEDATNAWLERTAPSS
ncbi:MAG: polysaccharide deacetylase [Rhodospirillaceae bacterium]|nr:polysaccharide deacetylase [Rhodospirillaceae bacterium]